MKEKLRQAETGHFTETDECAQVWAAVSRPWKIRFGNTCLGLIPNWDDFESWPALKAALSERGSQFVWRIG
jgi:hypothetical protein